MANHNQHGRGAMRSRDDDRDQPDRASSERDDQGQRGYRQGYWGDRSDRVYAGRRGGAREYTGYSGGPTPQAGGFDGDFKSGGSMHTGYGRAQLDRRRPGQGGHRGKSPVGYHRSDERIWEAVCEALTDNDYIDPTAIEVTVKDGEVTLAGSVPERYMKRMAEDCIEGISGVTDVQNQLRIRSGRGTPSASPESKSETEMHAPDTKHRA